MQFLLFCPHKPTHRAGSLPYTTTPEDSPNEISLIVAAWAAECCVGVVGASFIQQTMTTRQRIYPPPPLHDCHGDPAPSLLPLTFSSPKSYFNCCQILFLPYRAPQEEVAVDKMVSSPLRCSPIVVLSSSPHPVPLGGCHSELGHWVDDFGL